MADLTDPGATVLAMADEQPDEQASEYRDELPADLDVTGYVGPYLFPPMTRRRIPATMYLVLARRVPGRLRTVVERRTPRRRDRARARRRVPLRVRRGHSNIDQTEALLIASRTVGFAVGHSSAQLAWHGLRARPVWRILLYSADAPPTMRGLVQVDAVDGTVMGEYTEPNPEDWSKYGLDEVAPSS